MDNEDSVAAVDAEDKIRCYRNWLGIMKGDLEAKMEKNGKKIIRKLNPDRNYIGVDGSKNMIKKAKNKDSKGKYYQSNIESWNSDNQFDLVFSMETFYYLENILGLRHCSNEL